MESLLNILAILGALVVIGVVGALVEWGLRPDLGNDCVYRTRDFDKPFFSEPRRKKNRRDFLPQRHREHRGKGTLHPDD